MIISCRGFKLEWNSSLPLCRFSLRFQFASVMTYMVLSSQHVQHWRGHQMGGNPHCIRPRGGGPSRSQKRGVEFKGGNLHDGFGGFDGVFAVPERTLPSFCLSYKRQHNEAILAVLTVSALVGLRTQTQNAAFFERKGPKRKPWPRGQSLNRKKWSQCVFWTLAY